MVQILNNPSSASLLGQSLGTGLGEGLQQLAHHKMQEMLKGKQVESDAEALMQLYNIDRETARKIAGSPLLTKMVYERGLEIPQGSSSMGFGQDLSSMSGMQALSDNEGNMQQRIPSAMQEMQQVAQQEQYQNPFINAQLKKIRLGEKPEERMHKERIAQKEEIASRKEALDLQKMFKEDIKEAYKGAREAKNDLEALNRMQELESTGNLDTAGYNEFLKRSGLDIAALRNPESEEFEKLQARFIRGAQKAMGGRVTNFELQQFLKGIPNLSLSPEGRKRVIAGLKNIARADIIYGDTMKDIIRKNKGIPPADLLTQLEEKAGVKLDKLHDMFLKDLNKPVPKSQNKAITTAQAIGGDILGTLKNALAPAASGALLGARFGGPQGALLGGLGGLLGPSVIKSLKDH